MALNVCTRFPIVSFSDSRKLWYDAPEQKKKQFALDEESSSKTLVGVY